MSSTIAVDLDFVTWVQAYGRELSEAYEWLSKFRVSRKEAELHQAWDLYYHVFKRINKQLHSMTTLELQYVAPALVGVCRSCYAQLVIYCCSCMAIFVHAVGLEHPQHQQQQLVRRQRSLPLLVIC